MPLSKYAKPATAKSTGEVLDDKAAGPKIFTPLQLSEGCTLKNRTVLSPMCQYSCVDGFASNYHLVHLGQYALRGFGLLIVEATAVEPKGRISPSDLGIWSDAHAAALKPVVDFVHQVGDCKVGIQLAHAGRKGSTQPLFAPNADAYVTPEEGGWVPVAPSPIKFSETSCQPKELTKDEIKKLVQDFVDAAKRADAVGFDVVEIHGAHGYLIHEFLSPISNKRTDEYGGSFENRTRFLVEITTAVRKVWPASKPLLVRLSCTDWIENGWSIEDTVKLCQLLKTIGVNAIDCSSGAIAPQQQIKYGPSYQVPFAQAVKERAGLPTIAVGAITDAKQANDIIEEGRADMVAVARVALRQPTWVYDIADELGANIQWLPQYSRGKLPKN